MDGTTDNGHPLQFSNRSQMLDTLKTYLVGLSFDTVTIKKQGTGIYQLGDLIKYHAPDSRTHKMLIMGIAYDFSNGFFSETLYSLAPSESQQRNQGNKVNQEALTSKAVQGSADKLIGDFGGQFMLQWDNPNWLSVYSGWTGKKIAELNVDSGTNFGFRAFDGNGKVMAEIGKNGYYMNFKSNNTYGIEMDSNSLRIRDKTNTEVFSVVGSDTYIRGNLYVGGNVKASDFTTG